MSKGTSPSTPSPGQRIAAALRRSPIHVDPSLAEALPAPERARLLEKMRRSPIPIFIVIVPLAVSYTHLTLPTNREV